MQAYQCINYCYNGVLHQFKLSIQLKVMLFKENVEKGNQSFIDRDGDGQQDRQPGFDLSNLHTQPEHLETENEQTGNELPTNSEQLMSPPHHDDRDELSQADIVKGIKTFEERLVPHAALETPEGKNNGAKPAAFRGQQINHP